MHLFCTSHGKKHHQCGRISENRTRLTLKSVVPMRAAIPPDMGGGEEGEGGGSGAEPTPLGAPGSVPGWEDVRGGGTNSDGKSSKGGALGSEVIVPAVLPPVRFYACIHNLPLRISKADIVAPGTSATDWPEECLFSVPSWIAQDTSIQCWWISSCRLAPWRPSTSRTIRGAGEEGALYRR